MNIRQALKPYDDDKKLKVGSFQSYFYVGTVGHFLENQKEISGELYTKVKERAEESRKAYNTRLQKPPTFERFCKQQEVKSRKFTSEAYLEYLNDWLQKTKIVLDNADRAKEREETFRPLSKRMVRFIRKSDPAADDECIILIIEGKEAGKFWTTDEAPAGSVGISAFVNIDEEDADE